MLDSPQNLLWNQPAWLAQAHAWISQSLERQGIYARGPIEQVHVQPWSTILRFWTADGLIYFKASIPLLKHEPALTQVLSQMRPDLTLSVIAADHERGWMLVPDGGPRLREFLKSPEDLKRVEGLLPKFASLQIEMGDHLDDLLPRVPFDRRLDQLPGMFERLVEDRTALRVGNADGLRADQYQHLGGLVQPYREMCTRLAAYRVPHSLHHDDFHDGNIFGNGESASYIIADWGESCLAHPFFSMLIFLRSVSDRVGLPEEMTDIPEAFPPDLIRLRDIYLEPWERFETKKHLVDIFNLAWRVGMVNRALTWHQVVSSLDPEYQSEYAYIVPAWLGEFLTLMERGNEF